MINYLINFTSVWSILVIIGFTLIFFRSDSERVGEDIDGYFYNKPIYIKLGTFILFVAILPFSIPYSLSNILTKRK
jgi:hypothetical protein